MAMNKGNLSNALDVLSHINEALKVDDAFSNCSLDCNLFGPNDHGEIIFTLFDGTRWKLSSRHIQPID